MHVHSCTRHTHARTRTRTHTHTHPRPQSELLECKGHAHTHTHTRTRTRPHTHPRPYRELLGCRWHGIAERQLTYSPMPARARVCVCARACARMLAEHTARARAHTHEGTAHAPLSLAALWKYALHTALRTVSQSEPADVTGRRCCCMMSSSCCRTSLALRRTARVAVGEGGGAREVRRHCSGTDGLAYARHSTARTRHMHASMATTAHTHVTHTHTPHSYLSPAGSGPSTSRRGTRAASTAGTRAAA